MIYSRLLCFATALTPTTAIFGLWGKNNTESSGVKELDLPDGLTFVTHRPTVNNYRSRLQIASKEQIERQATWYDRVLLKDQKLYDGLKLCIAHQVINEYNRTLEKFIFSMSESTPISIRTKICITESFT